MRRFRKAIWRSSEEESESLPSYDDFKPLDTREQVEMVESFEKSHTWQNAVWRGIFSALLFSFAGFFIYSAHQQFISPWEARYHAYFMEEVDSRIVIFADWMAAMAFSTDIVGLLWKSKYHVYWFWFSSAIGLLLACFWIYQMLRLSTFRWDIIWLPFGPLSCAGMCMYIDQLLLEALEDIRRLRASIYHFKKT